MYLRWRQWLPAWIRIESLELPGRGARIAEPPVEVFDALVARLCDELAPKLPGNYALFGHSMGALLAYGVANGLWARKAALPAALLISACAAPTQREHERFANKDDDAALIAELRKQGGTPDEVFANPELLRMTLAVLGADYRVCESFRYRARPPLPFHIHVFGGRGDVFQPSRLAAWRNESALGSTLDWFVGGHFFLKQHEQIFLRRLAQRLAGDTSEVADATAAFA